MAPERSAPAPRWLDSLVDEFGTESVQVGAEAPGFATPWRGRAGRCAAVVLPSSEEEVVALVEFALGHGARLIAQGANTGLVESGVPDDSGQMIVVSTNRLRREIDIDAIGATAKVGAGCRLSELNEAAAAVGLRLPVDLSADPSIGGMVATNAAGSYVLRFGPTRNQLLGLEVCVADPEPRMQRWATGLRKDARGPATWLDFVGAQGQLGIITAAAVALTPLPTDRACAFLRFANLDHALAALPRLRATLGPGLVAFEVISGTALRLTAEYGPVGRITWPDSQGSPHEDEKFTALIEVETFGEAAESRLVEAIAGLTGAEAEPRDTAVVPVERAWALRHSISSALAHAGQVLGLDIAVPVHRLAVTRQHIHDHVSEQAPGAILADFGHAGDGGLHANIVFPQDAPQPSPADLDALRMDLSRLVANEGGTFSAEHGLGPANAAIWMALTAPADLRAWEAVKNRWDPAGIFGRRPDGTC